MSDSDLINAFKQALLDLDRAQIRTLIEVGDHPSLRPIEQIIVPALEQIGVEWEQGGLSLSQVYMSGRICEELVGQLLPAGHSERKDQPKMAIAVLEDYHLLGKRIVHSVLRASGYVLTDYGQVNVDDLVTRVCEDEIELLMISTLMLPSALKVGDVRKKLDARGAHTRIVVGGAPFRFDAELWKEVSADAMGRGASEIVALIDRVMGEGK